MLTISLVYEQSHIIVHSQGLTNGLSDRDYRVLTISLFYVQSHIIAHSQGLANGLSDRDYRVLTISLVYVQSHIIAHSQGLTMDSQTGTIECSLFPYFMYNHIL